jgi:hypothetical protein
MTAMEWIRANLKTIGAVLVFAMALPFLLTLFGIVRW